MRMYDYTLSFLELENLLVSGQIDAETYQDTLKSIEGDAYEKAENLSKMIDNFKAQAEMLKAEAKKLNEKRKTLENNIEWLTGSLEAFLKATGKDSLTVGMYTLKYRKLPDMVHITNEKVIPKAYKIPQDPKIDKRAIARVLKDGEVVRGARLETGRTKFEVKK